MSDGPCPLERYLDVRRATERLCEPLAVENYVVQAMPDVSPAGWHLAHVSWFFETFVLKTRVPDYQGLDDHYVVLFNSYYNGVGPQLERARRGRRCTGAASTACGAPTRSAAWRRSTSMRPSST